MENSMTLKMRGLGKKTSCKVYRILVSLKNKGKVEDPLLKKSIDMTKVRGYLDSMGTEVPANAKSLFSAVEQYQRMQESSMSSLHNMLPGGSTPVGTGMNGLSGLLAMAASFGAFPSTGISSAVPRPHNRQSTKSVDGSQSIDTETSSPETNKISCDKEKDSSSRLDSSESSSESKLSKDLQTANAGKAGMLQMLQGICGKMSSVRVAENDRKSQDSISNSSVGQGESKSETSAPDSDHSSVENDLLQPLLQHTMSAVKESEDRLKLYIDSKLAAMEARIGRKLDNVLITLQQNLQNNKKCEDTES